MSEEDFDKAMRGLISMPWSAKEWREKRAQKRKQKR